jgi:hypothetical protein
MTTAIATDSPSVDSTNIWMREDVANVVDKALDHQRLTLCDAIGIVRLASDALQRPETLRSRYDISDALDGALRLLTSIADRIQDTETLLTLGNFQ